MRKFHTKVAVFSGTVLITILAYFQLADGYADPYYLRLTSPLQHNLILGTSRAAQGLRPDVLDTILGTQMYNFAFTLGHSPYGPTYLRRIEEKISPLASDGSYLVAVDPWALSVRGGDPLDSLSFPEREYFLGRVHSVNASPNYDYLINHYDQPYTDLLLRRWRAASYLHADGWLEVNPPMDVTSAARRHDKKIREYRASAPEYQLSEVRIGSLVRTLNLLRRHGRVYLVRLPTHHELYTLEQERFPEFDRLVRKRFLPLAEGYLDLMPRTYEFRYTDGNHLYRESAREVSRMVGEWMACSH